MRAYTITSADGTPPTDVGRPDAHAQGRDRGADPDRVPPELTFVTFDQESRGIRDVFPGVP
jgi:hypothetical protein